MKTAQLFHAINSKILLSASMVIAAGALIIGATFAFYADTETSQGNVLGAGALDLLIDNDSYYNGVLSPDNSWLEKNENVIETGPIGQAPHNFPVTRTIADSLNNIFSGLPNDPLAGGDLGPTHYIAAAWCFGSIAPAALPQSNYTGPDNAANDGV